MTKTNKAPTTSFVPGDRVIVTTAATKQEPAAGVVTHTTSTGWYVCQLDEPERFTGCPAGKVSARLSSLQPENAKKPPKAGSVAGDLAAANKGPSKPKADRPPKAPKPAPKLPTECPECESGELETETDDGNTTVSCSCGWEETIAPDPESASKMADALRKAREHYVKDRRPDGAQTAHCGDAIARELKELEPRETADLADKVLQQPHGFHFGKYQNLNNGQIRMNSGNRIRAYWKGINEDGNEAEIARVGKLLNLIEE